MNRTMKVVTGLLLLVAGAALGAGGVLWATGTAPASLLHAFHDHEAAEGNGDGDEVLYYRHPHDSSITSDEPKQDSMGMDYIPVRAGEDDDAGDDGRDVVRIRPGIVQSMNVRTADAESGALPRVVRAVGHVLPHEGLSSRVDLRNEGWVEEMAVRHEGERVEEGQVLFRYFSPRLLTAQDEFVQAAERGAEREMVSARRRLLTLGMDPDAIATLEREREVSDRIAVRAPRDGVVKDLAIREGDYLEPGRVAMTIADLSRVWVIASVVGEQAGWVQPGDGVAVRDPYNPERTREGTVESIDPVLDPVTRTTPVRVLLDNPDGALRPGAYTRMRIDGEPGETVTHVPRHAVIRTGEGSRVILAEGDGRFRVRPVETGTGTRERLAVRGIEPGRTVVTSGHFLIDSEAALTPAMERLEGVAAGEVAVSGTIEAIDTDEGTITIDHEAIPELDMGAMTMDFQLGPDVAIGDLAAGDRVAFALREAEDAYTVTRIERERDEADHEPDADHDHGENGHDEHDHGEDAHSGNGHGEHDHGEHDHDDHGDDA